MTGMLRSADPFDTASGATFLDGPNGPRTYRTLLDVAVPEFIVEAEPRFAEWPG